jgi:phosphoribosyl-dephospho-CoA transferase
MTPEMRIFNIHALNLKKEMLRIETQHPIKKIKYSDVNIASCVVRT